MKARSRLLHVSLMVVLSFLIAGGWVFAGNTPSSTPGSPPMTSKSINVSKAELKRFATALGDVQGIQVTYEKRFRDAVTSSSLGRKQFVQIYRSMRSTHALPSNLSESKKKEFQQLFQTLMSMDKAAQHKIAGALENDGFTVNRFDAIVTAVHNDPKLAGRLKAIEN